MDILFAYHQVEVEPDSVEETAFVFKFGQYEIPERQWDRWRKDWLLCPHTKNGALL